MLNFTDEVVKFDGNKYDLTERDIETIMVNGLEGGIGYWAILNNSGENWVDKPRNEPSSMWATKLLLEGKEVEFYDNEGELGEFEEEETWYLTLENLIKGYDLNFKHRRFDSNLEEGDATTCDCIIQYALFNKIVYG